MNLEKIYILHNPTKKFPYEVWFGNELIETFVSEESAKEMISLQKDMEKLYIKNKFEKLNK